MKDQVWGFRVFFNAEMEVYESTKWLSTAKVYYWKLLTASKVYGPFNSITETIMHYDFFKAAMASQPASNVIFVDFVGKKRLAI